MSAHEYCKHDIRVIECRECSPPAPPAGLDWDAAFICHAICPDGCEAEVFSNAILNAQHLAALAHARAEAKREAVEEIVKAVTEKAEQLDNQPGLHPMHAYEWRAAADFIAQHFGSKI